MPTIRRVIVLCLALLASVALAGKLQVDHDPEVDFSTIRTYAWKEGVAAPNPKVQKAIVGSIESELEAKGLSQVPTAEADVLVVTYVGGKMDLEIWGNYITSPTWRVGLLQVDVRDVTQGALAIQMLEPGSEDLVWLALASRGVSDNPEKVVRQVESTVKKMFKKYPSN
jgi:hypothetical protein